MLWDIALEFSETTIRMATRENGLAFSAPSWGAFRGDKLIAIGDDALDMLGRTPPGYFLTRPFSGGSIEDARLTSQWLKRLLEPFVTGAKVIKPSVVFIDNGMMHPSEKELLITAAHELGAGQCGFLSSDVAAASGAGLNVRRPDGIALLDVGAGTMSAALLSFGRLVAERRLPYGLDQINDGIIHQVREEAALSIGPRTAEELKLVLASALPARDVNAIACGLDMTTGLPCEKKVSAQMIQKAVAPVVNALVLMTRELIQLAPDELSADLLKNGLVLTGGGALLSGLDTLLTQQCALPCHRPETPSLCIGKGMARILQDSALSEVCIRPF